MVMSGTQDWATSGGMLVTCRNIAALSFVLDVTSSPGIFSLGILPMFGIDAELQ